MDRNVVETDQYKFKWRARHTTAVVGEVLYCWGGDKEGLDESHNSSTKRQCTSAIDAFNLLSGVWSSRPTRGTPPLGIRGVSCTTIDNNIYYFGGYCGHDSCFHNSLNCLDTLTLQWKELQPTDDNSVNKRAYGGIIAMGSEGEPQQLLVIGGIAPISTTTHYHSQFKYRKIPDMDERVRINEQNMYNLSSGQWIVPSVSGQCCPPTDSFIIERISPNKGIMYGGLVSHGGISIPTNSIYLFQLSHCNDSIIINWEILKPGAIPIDGVWPKERCAHASTIINGVSTSPTLVVIGGMDHRNELVKECLLLDTNQYNWMKIPLPDSVTGRYYHTVSSFVLDPNHVFLIIVGGDVESMDWINRRVPDPLITMLIELVFNDGQWSVGPVLDSFNIPLWYELILKERRKEYMTNKVKELQVINESLCHDLQVSRINNQSLQEALLALESEKSMLETHLLETKTLLTKRKRDQEDSPNSDNVKKLKTDESVEEKQTMTDDGYEKHVVADELKKQVEEQYQQITKELESQVTELEEEKEQVKKQYLVEKQTTEELKNEVTELKEEKEQVEEEKSKVEKQYLMEKQITKELKAKVTDKEKYTAKLMKEKEQLQERVASLEEKSIKETSSKEVQFDYMIPSMDNLEYLSDVQVAEKKLFLIQGDKPQLMNWEKYGLRIGVQEGSLLSSETVEAAVVALVGGQFEFPPNTVLVSAVYAVSLSKPLLKQLKLEIQHCVDLTGWPDLAQYLKFAIAPVSTPSLPYHFSIIDGGEFSSNSGYGSIQRNKFCLVCILGEEWTNGGGNGVPIASVNGDTEEGEEEQQPQQEEEEEEEGDKEEGEGSDSDDDTSSTPPGASGACKESTTKETNLPANTVSVAGPTTTPNTDHANKVKPTGVMEAMTYAGLVYYEEDGIEDLVTFTAAKNLEALIHFIERKHSQAKDGPDISFSFKFPYDYVELNLTAQQDEPFTGWILRPHTKPTGLYQEAIDKFGDKEHSRPSCCLISVYGSPDAVPFLNYFIPLEGVARPVSLNIHRARRNFTVTVPPSTNPTTSSSSNVHESTALSTGGAIAPSSSGNDETIPVPTKRRREGVGFDIKTAKQKIKQVMNENHSDYADILESSLKDIANKLFEAKIITRQVQRSPTYDAIASSFLTIMNLLDSKSDLEKHCVKYLEALSSVGGPIEFVANLLREKWTTALEGALQFEQSVKRARTNYK